MNKTALITGASRGIGRAAALELAKSGYNTALNYHQNHAAAQQLLAALGDFPIAAATFCADVADCTQVERMVEAVNRQLGPIDLLVNNAGIAGQKLFTDLSSDEWRRMFAVNVDGVFHTCRTVLPQMIARHAGNIINLSSIWGMTGASCEVHYSAAKAAVIGLTKALAKEVGPSNIRVNCVAPGVIETAMLSGLTADDLQALRDETPIGRLGTPADIAGVIAFLASDRADFLTGQVISPNGGFLIL